MNTNEAENPTSTAGTVKLIPFESVHAAMLERCQWAMACMPGLWDRFITKLELETFGEREILMEGKRIRNIYGSVADIRKVFMEAAKEWFDPEIDRRT